MNWPIALVLAVTFWCIGAAWGAAMTHRDDDKRYRHLVSADAGQRTAIRALYVAEGYEPPDFYADAEPEPRESWWRRLGAWMRGQQRATVIAPVAKVEEERHDLDEVAREFGVDLDEPDDFEPDPLPQTDPHGFPPQPGPKTQPAAAVIDADWAARSAQMLAEAQAAIDAIGGRRR